MQRILTFFKTIFWHFFTFPPWHFSTSPFDTFFFFSQNNFRPNIFTFFSMTLLESTYFNCLKHFSTQIQIKSSHAALPRSAWDSTCCGGVVYIKLIDIAWDQSTATFTVPSSFTMETFAANRETQGALSQFRPSADWSVGRCRGRGQRRRSRCVKSTEHRLPSRNAGAF